MAERRELQKLIGVVRDLVPDAVEGLSYGLPAFKLKNWPVVGFAAIKNGLSLYPYDPKIVRATKDQFPELDYGKGVVYFSPQNPIPEEAIAFVVSLRLEQYSRR